MKKSFKEDTFQQEENPYGKSEIFKAVEESDPKKLAGEIFAGGDVNKCTVYGDSPLQIALCSESIRPKVREKIVSQLLRVNADSNYIHPSEDGNSVAMLFFKRLEPGNKLHPLISLLVKNGADLWMKNDAGLTGRDILKSKYSPELLSTIPGFCIHIEISDDDTESDAIWSGYPIKEGEYPDSQLTGSYAFEYDPAAFC